MLHKLKSFAVILCFITIVGSVAPAYCQDNSDQVNAWRRAAAAGDSDATMALADTYQQGWGVQKNEEEAFKWYLKAATVGNQRAQYMVGRAYATGVGVEQNHQEAVSWYRKVALLGNSAAQNSLGDAYFYGRGVAVDKQAAIGWYQKSANHGNPDAEYSLAEAYRKGDGVEQNYELAAALYRKALEKGNAAANMRLLELEEAPDQSISYLIKNSVGLQLLLVAAVMGSVFFIIKIRKRGEDLYKLSFFFGTQFGLLIFGAVFFYTTQGLVSACDPRGQDRTFCESTGNVGVVIALLTIVLALITNIKRANPQFGAFYTIAQMIAAYTFILGLAAELLKDLNPSSFVKKKQK
jgi:hypothetical protein